MIDFDHVACKMGFFWLIDFFQDPGNSEKFTIHNSIPLTNTSKFKVIPTNPYQQK